MAKLKKSSVVSEKPTFTEVKRWYEQNLHPDANEYDDLEVYKHVYHEGRFPGIFQCTSAGAQKFFVQAKPESITDIAALTSIYRPGPLAANVDKIYLDAKQGKKFEWGHPLFEKVLGDTYNCMIFQEACLTGDTLVSSPSGDVQLSKLKPGDKVRSLNERSKQFEDDTVVQFSSMGKKEILEVETTMGTLKITPDHLVLTRRGWVEAGSLTLEDEIIKCSSYTHVCVTCGIPYTSRYKKSRCCGYDCLNIWKSKAYLGRKLTPEWLLNQKKAKLRENFLRKGDYTCEKCDTKFTTNTSLRSHRSYCSNELEKRNVRCEVCLRTFKRQRNLTSHMKYHDEAYVKKIAERISDGIAKSPNRKTTSQEEINFGNNVLRSLYGDELVSKFRIEGVKHEYDFYVPSLNLIIEYDGDYHHGYKKTQAPLSKWQKVQYHIDKNNTIAARNRGYQIHRVWGSESRYYPQLFRIDL